jgi:hypothetical protein
MFSFTGKLPKIYVLVIMNFIFGKQASFAFPDKT